MTHLISRTSCKFVLAAFTAALALPMLAAPADAAKGKKAQRSTTYNSAPAPRSYDSTYYYRGTGTTGQHDRARPFFGSPVRGIEFFESVARYSSHN